MGSITSTIEGFDFTVQCVKHRTPVVGALELGVERMKCLESRGHFCSRYWYIEITFTDFQFPREENDGGSHDHTG